MMRFCIIITCFFPAVSFCREFSVDSSCIPVIAITASQTNICLGNTVTFQANLEHGGLNSTYRWLINKAIVDASNIIVYTTAKLAEGDVIVCEYGCKTPCNTDTTIFSNPITIHVINAIEPSITVSNNDSLICEGEITLFTTQVFFGTAVPFYHWTVNGSNVGSDSPTYATSTITNGARIECTLTITEPACPGYSRSANSQLTIYVYPLIHPAIVITPSKSDICRGETVSFTATANGGAAPSFVWEINGLPTGDVGRALITSSLKNGDSVSCTITIDQDSRCHTTTSAPSNRVGITVHDFPDPAVSINSPNTDVCFGTPVIFTATPQNPGVTSHYQWVVNGHESGDGSPIFSSSSYAGDNEVYCVLSTDIPGCPLSVSVTSDSEKVTVRNAPVIVFSPPEISVLYGEPAQLNAIITGSVSSIAWSPPEYIVAVHSLTTATIPLLVDTVFTLAIIDTNGCTTVKDLPVKILHKIYMPSGFTPNADGLNDVFRIPPGSSVSLQQFSIFDRWGNQVFSTNDVTRGWDGTYKGYKLNNGSFTYFISGIVQSKQVFIKGVVNLVR